MTTTATQFTVASVEIEVLTDTIVLNLWESLEDHPLVESLVAAALNLGESEALEVGLMLIRASHTMEAARIARGERKRYTIAEIEDAHLIAARYPR